MDSSDRGLQDFATQWEKKLLDNDPNDLFLHTHTETDVNDPPDSKHLQVLFQKFGHKKFRTLQWKIIRSILTDKNDNCAIMATGYGKSLCYQFPAVYSGGITIVVSPLISLMEDQVLSLTMKNISSCLLGSAQTNQNTIEEILENKYSVVYLTPEFCTGDCGLNLLKNMHFKLQITLVAVDEAHCVSSWGHDFRPAYKKLGILKDIFFDTPVLALTATATEQVKKDIVNTLNLKNSQIFCSDYNRPNLYLSVKPKSSSIIGDLKSLMIRKNSRWVFEGSTIIYCVKRKDTETISDLLQSMEITSLPYHAGMSLKARKEAHENFVKDKVSVIVATIAFGMGIDKPDIRNVIHYGASNSIESYYQEIGRAGRDGLPSKCVAFYGNQDFNTHLYLINQSCNKDKKFQLLDVMKEYLMSRKCRRELILLYFTPGLDLSLSQKDDCCDNCSQKNNIPDNEVYEGLDDKDMYDFTEDAVKFLSAVNAMDGKFGIEVYILFLRGSKNSKVYERFRSHSYYGSGKETSVDWWKAIANFLQVKCYLKKITCRGRHVGNYLTTGISEKGRTFLQEALCGKKMIEQPTTDILKLLKKKQHCSGWISANGSSLSNKTKTQPSNPKRKISVNSETEESTVLETPDVTEDILNLFRLLKNCRTQLAADSDCMPYMIVSDFVLMEIAKRRPFDLQQLHNMQIEGLRDAIVDKFGADFLKVVRDNTGENICIREMTREPKLSILDILQEHPIEQSNQGQTVMTSYFYFKNGLTVLEIATKRNIKPGTVTGHLITAMKLGYPIKMEQLAVTPKVRTTIIQVINNLDGRYSLISPINNACPSEITCDQIKVVCAFLEIRAHLNKVGLPYQEFENFIYNEKDISLCQLNEEEALNDDKDDLLLAICDAMENEMSNKTDPSMLNQIDDVNILKNVSPYSSTLDLTYSEPLCKKVKIDTNSVLNSPPRQFSNDVEVKDDIQSKTAKIFDQGGSQIEKPIDKKLGTASKTKKKLPQWLSKKRKS